MKIRKTAGGQGGKRGHSNMCHWCETEIIKKITKRARRTEAKKQCKNHYH